MNVSNTTAPAPTTDTTAPSVSFSSPSSGQKVSGNVAIKGTAADNLGAAGITLTLMVNDKAAATATGGSLSYTWNTRKLASGSNHVLKLTARDAASNLAGTSITVSIK